MNPAPSSSLPSISFISTAATCAGCRCASAGDCSSRSSPAAVRLSDEVQADGDEFFRVACEHGLEGIIAKHVEKPYRSGRGEWWQKITCKRRNSFVIVGFEPSTVPGHLGRLLLAASKDGALVYVGGCGTGWSHELSRELRKLLEGMVTKTPAVALRRKGAVFVEPVLVAEVEYRAWTDDGKLRHASFKGVRATEDAAEIHSFDDRIPGLFGK